ncbi:MAG: hypothetical protein CMF50_03430 [Legionellales bacterium]|nr:hypothetical protein [Legionellales bacterium]|tara:strand:+ start:15189 stop:15563 length:375 start_codon:yes stop_codon:yes gene_type:complete
MFKRVFLKSGFFLIATVFVFSVMGILLICLGTYFPSAEEDLHVFLSSHKEAFFCWRLVIITTVVYTWPWVIRQYNKIHNMNSNYTTNLQQLRWKILFLWIILELLLGQQLIESTYSAVMEWWRI